MISYESQALYFYYDSQILPKFDHVHDIHSWILDRIVHRNCLFTPDARSLNARDMEDLCRHAVFFLSPFAENREVHPFCRLSCWNRIQPHIALKNPPENGLKFDFLLGDTCKLHMSTRKKILKNLREKTIQKLVTENQKSLQPEVCWFSVLSAILFEFSQVSLHWKTFPFNQQTDDKWTNYSAGVEQSLSSKLFLCKGPGDVERFFLHFTFLNSFVEQLIGILQLSDFQTFVTAPGGPKTERPWIVAT